MQQDGVGENDTLKAVEGMEVDWAFGTTSKDGAEVQSLTFI